MSITHVSSLNQLNKLLGKQGKLTVIDFHATWCGPCKTIAPTFEKLSKENPNVNFVKVDVDEAQEVAQKYSVTAMPTFVFIKGSDVVHSIRGAQSSALISSVAKYSSGSTSSAAFQGPGHTLGGTNATGKPVVADTGGILNLSSEVKIVAGLVVGYLFLMFFMS